MKKLYFFILLAFTANLIFAQSIFDNPITGLPVPGATVNPYTTGQNVNANITVSGIGRGPGVVGVDLNNSYGANSWNTTNIDLTAYFEFTLTPNASTNINFINFAFTLQNSATGALNYALRSSADGFASDIGTLVSANGGAANTIDLSAPAYQNITSAITFRIYGWNASGGGGVAGTFRVNDFTFNGVTSVLPVKFNYLNGSKQGANHSLNWKATCSNVTGVDFSVERSTDGRNFNSINTFNASAARCLQPFNFIDNNPAAGKNYYRLKVTEDNGNILYSTVILLLNADAGFDIAGLQPSVVNTTALLNVTAAQKTKLNVVVTDYAGRQVQQQTYSLVSGSNQLDMNFANLAAGTYQITAITANGQKAAVRFIKQ